MCRSYLTIPSIIKIILLRFCSGVADGSVPDMGKRVMAANHLGHALTEPAPRSSPAKENYQHVVAALAGWHAEQFDARFQRDHVRTHHPRELNDFQKGLLSSFAAIYGETRKENQRNGQDDRCFKQCTIILLAGSLRRRS